MNLTDALRKLQVETWEKTKSSTEDAKRSFDLDAKMEAAVNLGAAYAWHEAYIMVTQLLFDEAVERIRTSIFEKGKKP